MRHRLAAVAALWALLGTTAAFAQAPYRQVARLHSDPAHLGVAPSGTIVGVQDVDVFTLTRPAAPPGAWTFTVAEDFLPNYGLPQGTEAKAGPTLGDDGAFYGTTSQGGADSLGNGGGVVWRLAPPATPGAVWTYQVIHTFPKVFTLNHTDGKIPFAGVALDRTGAVYGTTFGGGKAGRGVIYRLTAPASGQTAWSESILYDFPSPALDASTATAAPVFDAGQTTLFFTNGFDSVFAFDLARSKLTAIASLPAGRLSNVVVGTGGVLYLEDAPSAGSSALYRLSPPAGTGAWSLDQIFAPTSGALMVGGRSFARDTSGRFYVDQGSATSGAVDIVRLDPVSGGLVPTVLHTVPPPPQVTSSLDADGELVLFSHSIVVGEASWIVGKKRTTIVFRQATQAATRGSQ